MKLKFNGEVSLPDVMEDHRFEIYDCSLVEIQKAYKDSSVENIKILTICINGFEHDLNLNRSNLINYLNTAIKQYESVEKYEKCQECLDIINYLKKQ
jgi:hypothetical protein